MSGAYFDTFAELFDNWAENRSIDGRRYLIKGRSIFDKWPEVFDNWAKISNT